MAGHTIVIVIGDFTATIGDPTGKNKARQKLSLEQTIANSEKIEAQIRKLLLPDNLEIHHNKNWLSSVSNQELLEIFSLININHILSRKDFKMRSQQGIAINMNEVIYPILQSLDSIHLNIDLEVGGKDQRLNFLLTRSLQKKMGLPIQSIALFPLLENNKKEKMSKSSGNCINLNIPKNKIKDKLLQTPDECVKIFLNLLTDVIVDDNLSNKELQVLLADTIIKELNQVLTLT